MKKPTYKELEEKIYRKNIIFLVSVLILFISLLIVTLVYETENSRLVRALKEQNFNYTLTAFCHYEFDGVKAQGIFNWEIESYDVYQDTLKIISNEEDCEVLP